LAQILGEAGKTAYTMIVRDSWRVWFWNVGRQGAVDEPCWENAACYGFNGQDIETLEG
jgi:hypothetical protein